MKKLFVLLFIALIALPAVSLSAAAEDASVVYFTSDITAEGLVKIYEALIRLSVDCDCNGYPAEPDIHDIGILASADPVALDQACIDLVYQAEGNASLVRRIEKQHGIHALEHGEEIGLGSRTYELVNIDQ